MKPRTAAQLNFIVRRDENLPGVTRDILAGARCRVVNNAGAITLPTVKPVCWHCGGAYINPPDAQAMHLMEKIKSDIEPLGTWCPDCKAEKAYEIFMRHLLAYTTLMRCASCRPKLLHGGEWQCQRCSTRH